MPDTLPILLALLATLGWVAYFVSDFRHARERRDLYDRIQAGTLIDYTRAQATKADIARQERKRPVAPHVEPPMGITDPEPSDFAVGQSAFDKIMRSD